MADHRAEPVNAVADPRGDRRQPVEVIETGEERLARCSS